MHEEYFLSSWLKEDVEGIEERRKDREDKAREGESRRCKRKLEREEERTVIKRRCVNLRSSEVFEECRPMEDSWEEVMSGSCGLSECVPVVSSHVPVVTGASVLLPSGWCVW